MLTSMIYERDRTKRPLIVNLVVFFVVFFCLSLWRRTASGGGTHTLICTATACFCQRTASYVEHTWDIGNETGSPVIVSHILCVLWPKGSSTEERDGGQGRSARRPMTRRIPCGDRGGLVGRGCLWASVLAKDMSGLAEVRADPDHRYHVRD